MPSQSSCTSIRSCHLNIGFKCSAKYYCSFSCLSFDCEHECANHVMAVSIRGNYEYLCKLLLHSIDQALELCLKMWAWLLSRTLVDHWSQFVCPPQDDKCLQHISHHPAVADIFQSGPGEQLVWTTRSHPLLKENRRNETECELEGFIPESRRSSQSEQTSC